MAHQDESFEIKQLFETICKKCGSPSKAKQQMTDRVGPLWEHFNRLDPPPLPEPLKRSFLDKVRAVMIEEGLNPGKLIEKAGLDEGPPIESMDPEVVSDRIQIIIDRSNAHG